MGFVAPGSRFEARQADLYEAFVFAHNFGFAQERHLTVVMDACLLHGEATVRQRLQLVGCSDDMRVDALIDLDRKGAHGGRSPR